MRRRVVRVFMFLFVGLLVSVVVAWSFALKSKEQYTGWPTSPLPANWPYPHDLLGQKYFDLLQEENRQKSLLGSKDSRIGFTGRNEYSALGRQTDMISIEVDGKVYSHIHYSFGWPAACLVRWEVETFPVARAVMPNHVQANGIDGGWPRNCVGDGASPPRYWSASFLRKPLPLVPIFSGLVFNVLIYAASAYPIACLFKLIFRRYVHSSRARRGLCTRCRYPVVDLSQCPECGTLSLSRQSMEATGSHSVKANVR